MTQKSSQNVKRSVYLVAFTTLGLTFGALIASLLELYYTKLLLIDFDSYSYGLSWTDIFYLRDFFAVLVLVLSGWWGYCAGKYWWHQIYELRKFKHYHWWYKS